MLQQYLSTILFQLSALQLSTQCVRSGAQANGQNGLCVHAEHSAACRSGPQANGQNGLCVHVEGSAACRSGPQANGRNGLCVHAEGSAACVGYEDKATLQLHSTIVILTSLGTTVVHCRIAANNCAPPLPNSVVHCWIAVDDCVPPQPRPINHHQIAMDNYPTPITT